jgi:hypothetical protein
MADQVYLVVAKSDVDSKAEHYLNLERLEQGPIARVDRSNTSATLDYAASAPAPANDPSLTISGSAAHLSDLPRSLATYPMSPVEEASWLSRP